MTQMIHDVYIGRSAAKTLL